MRGDMTNDGYHYRECGLDRIHLLNGFEVKETGYGKVVAIHNLDGLHRAIGTHLVREKKNLSGPEIRFLRRELRMSQRRLGEVLQKSDQTVARWEKGTNKIGGTADRLLRVLYLLQAGGNRKIKSLLERLADLDNLAEERLSFEDTDRGWRLHVAA